MGSLDRLPEGSAEQAEANLDIPRDEPIRVLLCCNPAYCQHLAVTLVSLLENNPHNRFEIHLVFSARSAAEEAKLWWSLGAYRNFSVAVHDFSVGDCGHFFVDNHVTVDTYLRIFAADVLPHIDKILYLDCDLVVLGDLRELWSTDIGGHALAAAAEPYGACGRDFLGMPADRPYVNAGVMLLNLARWREAQLPQQLVRFIETHGRRLWYWDQDAINAVLHASILPLDYRWNVQAQMFKIDARKYPDVAADIRAACRRPAIIHYSTAEKPWRFRAIVKRKLPYFHYLAKTGWRGTKPLGLRWYHLPEFYLDHALARLGIDYTLIVRVLRRVRNTLRGSATRLRQWHAAPGRKPDTETSR